MVENASDGLPRSRWSLAMTHNINPHLASPAPMAYGAGTQGRDNPWKQARLFLITMRMTASAAC